MRKQKLYDTTLFSFERAEYERRVRQAVDIVFSKYRSSLQAALEKSFRLIMKIEQDGVTKVYKKITTEETV